MDAGVPAATIDKRVERGSLDIVQPCIYRVPGAAASDGQAVRAAYLAAGDDAAVSHLSAGARWDLEGIEAGRPEILLPHERRISLVGVVVRRTRLLLSSEVMARNGITYTSPARTLVDLAGIVPAPVLERALDDGLRRWIVTLDQIRCSLDARGPCGVKGWGRLDRLVLERVGTRPTGSGKETTFRRGLKRYGLPKPVAQYVVNDARGRFIARVDFAYPELMLAIEVDGSHHRDPTQWRKDLVRQNNLVLAGWRFLRFPKTDRAGQRDAFETIRAAFLAFGECDPTDRPVTLPKGLLTHD